MHEEPIELAHGSGNVFAGFGHPNADLEQARALIAAQIIGILDDHSLSTRAAARLTGVSRGDFSHIRSTRLSGFTLERIMAIFGKLDQNVDGQGLDKRGFTLDAEEFEKFKAMLDAPPSENPKLRKLMATQSPWEV